MARLEASPLRIAKPQDETWGKTHLRTYRVDQNRLDGTYCEAIKRFVSDFGWRVFQVNGAEFGAVCATAMKGAGRRPRYRSLVSSIAHKVNCVDREAYAACSLKPLAMVVKRHGGGTSLTQTGYEYDVVATFYARRATLI